MRLSFSTKSAYKNKFSAGIISFFKMIQYMFIQECEKSWKILGFGIDFEQNANLCLDMANSVCREINFSKEISL